MIDYSEFWNNPAVAAARGDVIAAAEAYAAGQGDEPALERAVLLFNDAVSAARMRLGHYQGLDDGGFTLTEEQRAMVRGRYLEEVRVAPPQTAVLVAARTCLLAAVRDLDNPLGKWEREFNFNCSCMRYAGKAMAARRAQKDREYAWRGTKPMPTTTMENSSLNAGG